MRAPLVRMPVGKPLADERCAAAQLALKVSFRWELEDWSNGKDIHTTPSVKYKSRLRRARAQARRVSIMHAWFWELFDAEASWEWM